MTGFPPPAADYVRILLRDCRVSLLVGIHEDEMRKPQEIIVNVEVEAAAPHRFDDLTERKLDRVISYEPVYDFIQKELPRLGHVPLLETVAEQIIGFCFRDMRVRSVRVRLEKPKIFAKSAAGVEIFRARIQTGA